MKNKLIALYLLPLLAFGQWGMDFDEDFAAASSKKATAIPQIRFTFLTGTFPDSITLGDSYAAPANPSDALYDPGDGVWVAYTTKTITRKGGYIAFAGDWRTVAGTYAYMFDATFQSTAYAVRMTGQLPMTPTSKRNAYAYLFRNCTAVAAIVDNPMPILTGQIAMNMFREVCNGMSGVVGPLPDGFLDTSGLTGNFAYPPTQSYFRSACKNMSGVTSLPERFMDLSGIFGVPAYLLDNSCYGMSGVTNAYVFNISSNVNLTSTSVVNAFNSSFANMTKWPGTVMWGTNVLFFAITPGSDANTVQNSTNVQDYATIPANWK